MYVVCEVGIDLFNFVSCERHQYYSFINFTQLFFVVNFNFLYPAIKLKLKLIIWAI